MLLSPSFRNYRFGFLTSALALALGAFPMMAAVPAAPVITVDPTQPNLFYGAIPPNGPDGPVVVFVHGLSGKYSDWIEPANCPVGVTCQASNNTMYDSAYQAGMRTVFLSLSLTNMSNNTSIQTNAAMLQTMFPKILAKYGVSSVFFVCHSKGGLDLQAAIATPQWLSMARAVIMLGTPNQGDALADWCFSSAGSSLCAGVGLNTPALQSLEVANVQSLRAQWDPIFQKSGIPFYTLSGNTYACASGSSCSTTVTGPILTSLTGGTAAPYNDGLVDHPETLLPTAYSMELGVIHSNHFGLLQGTYSFPFVLGRVSALDNTQPGVTRISTNGFGDQHNTWAWSMAWFKGKLYVGTGREVYCVTSATAAIKLGIPSLYPPAIGDCTPDYHYLPLQAEIWQYTPNTHAWRRVFQSPNSLSTIANDGVTKIATARDIGFRGLQLVTEPDGTQALYAGGVTSAEIFESPTAFGTWAPPRILRSVDGVNWAALPQDPGTFLGNIALNGTPQYPNYSIRSAAQIGNTLLLQVGDYPGVGRVFASKPGANPAGGDNNFDWASPATAQMPVWILQNFNNAIYAGTGNPPGAGVSAYGVFKTTATGALPFTWTPIIDFNGGYASGLVADYAMSLEVFSDPTYCPGIGCLYAGTDRPNEMVRIHPDTTGQVPVSDGNGGVVSTDSWDLVVGNPRTIPPGQPGAGQSITPVSGFGQYFDNGFTGHFWRMGVGAQGLYMGTWDWSSDNASQPTFAPLWSQEFGTDLWRTTDGVHWQFMSKVGLGDGNNTGGRSFSATPFGLFMGTARSIGGTQVFNVDNSILDYNKDGVIDQNDVNLMIAGETPNAPPNSPMDLNQDGKIDSTDVQLLTTQCTYVNCAIPSSPPITATLHAPVLHAAPGGGLPSLDWQPVAGATTYVIYRIGLSVSQTTPPPAKVNQACANPANTSLCSQLPLAQPAATPQYGYPGAPKILTQVGTTTYTDSSVPASTLQWLYFVRAQDALGNLSAPSNLVAAPSLAAQ